LYGISQFIYLHAVAYPLTAQIYSRPETARLVNNIKRDLLWKEAIISLLQSTVRHFPGSTEENTGKITAPH